MASGLNLAGWSPPVSAIAGSGSDLFVGGYLTSGTNTVPNFVDSWNGSTLVSYGSGLFSTILALVVSGDDMYAAGVGGVYMRQADQTQAHLAKLIRLAPPLLSIELATNGVTISWPAFFGDFTLQQSAKPDTDWLPSSETINDDGAIKYIIVNPTVGSRYYRLFKP